MINKRKNSKIPRENLSGNIKNSQFKQGGFMKAKKYINCFIIGFFLFAFASGCAGTRHKESTGEFVDDSVITTKVKAQIFDDPTLKVMQINVETFKGEVQLSGFVNSSLASVRAVEVARSVQGVRSVKNSLVVKN